MAREVPVGLDSDVWYNSAVWGPAEQKTYDDPHGEDGIYASATPFLPDIRNKSEEEAKPGVERMAAPFTWAELMARFGDRLHAAPLGARPKPAVPYVRAIHDATVPGLNMYIHIPGKGASTSGRGPTDGDPQESGLLRCPGPRHARCAPGILNPRSRLGGAWRAARRPAALKTSCGSTKWDHSV